MRKITFLVCAIFFFSHAFAQLNLTNSFNENKLVGYWDFTTNSPANLVTGSSSSITPAGTVPVETIDGVSTVRIDYSSDNENLNYLALSHALPVDDAGEVKDYCLVLDVYLNEDALNSAIGANGSLTSVFNNGNTRTKDGSLFLNRNGAIGLGAAFGYNVSGTVNHNAWNRIVLNVSVTNGYFNIYGIHQDRTLVANKNNYSGTHVDRFVMYENVPFNLFRDGDDNENGGWNVAAVALFNQPLSDLEIEALAQPKFTTSTDETGPWYFIQTLGSDTGRAGRLFTAEQKEDVIAVHGRALLTESFDAMDAQLWRIEEAEDGYTLINKAFPQYVKLAEWTPVATAITRATLSDTSTAFEIVETKSNPGYFQIFSGDKYLHQANSGGSQDFAIITEGSYWGSTADSFFKLVQFGNELTVDKEELNFGSIVVEEMSEELSLAVIKSDFLPGDYSYEIIGDEDAYGITRTETGYTILFQPLEEKEYNDILVIKCGDLSVEVALKGVGYIPIPGIISPSDDPSADENGDVWYRIQFNKRTFQFLTDMGDGEQLAATYFDANNDGQLWKITEEGDGYQLESKSGSFIVLDAEAADGAGRFVASGVQDQTFNFHLVDSDTWSWQIKMGDTYINKTNTDSNFTKYGVIGDAGSSAKFLPASEVYDHGFPTFSVGSDEHWYMIQFVRTAGPSYNFDRVLQNEGIDAVVTQSERNPDLATQYWKFVGDLEGCKIINFDGTEMKEASAMIVCTPSGEGNTYQFSSYAEQTWAIQDLTYGGSSAYFNDNGRTRAGYWSKDAGGEVQFIKVDPADIKPVSIDDVDYANDPIVAVSYYTIQGILIQEPTDTGIYIARYQHESGRYSAKKIFYRKN